MKHIYLSRKAIKAVQSFTPLFVADALLDGVCVEATAHGTRVIGSSAHALGVFDIKTRNSGIEIGERINFILTPFILAKIPRRTDSKDILVIVISDCGKFELFDWGTKIEFVTYGGNYARACQWLFQKTLGRYIL